MSPWSIFLAKLNTQLLKRLNQWPPPGPLCSSESGTILLSSSLSAQRDWKSSRGDVPAPVCYQTHTALTSSVPLFSEKSVYRSCQSAAVRSSTSSWDILFSSLWDHPRLVSTAFFSSGLSSHQQGVRIPSALHLQPRLAFPALGRIYVHSPAFLVSGYCP